MPQDVFRPRGLVTAPAPAAAPPGSLATASNVNLRRPGVLTPRRGLATCTTAPSLATVKKLWAGLGNVYAAGDDGGYELHKSSDGGATWAAVTLSSAGTNDTRYTDQAAEARGNLYFTRSNAVWALSGTSDTSAARSGRPRLPCGLCSENAGTPAVYTAGSVFKYRVTVVRRDTNGLVTEGPPSGAFYHYDTSLGTGGAVQVVGYLPNGNLTLFAAGDVIALYRSTLESTLRISDSRSNLDRAVAFESLPYYSGSGVGGLTGYVESGPSGTAVPMAPRPPGEPNEELRLVKEYVLTSTDISNGYYTIVDTLPVTPIMGRPLYTNPSQGGINDTHHPPPQAMALGSFQGALLFGNIRTPQEFLLRLLKVSGPNWARGADGLGYSTGKTGDTHSNTTVDNLPVDTGRAVGQVMVGSDFAAGTTITVLNSSTAVTISQAATGTHSGTAANYHDQITIDSDTYYMAAATAVITAGSLASVVCVVDDAQGTLAAISDAMARLAAVNTATPLTDARAAGAGDLQIDGAAPSTTTFGVWGSHSAAWFTIKGTLPSTSAGALTSESQAHKNAVAWCYPGEPEHWRWTYRRLGEAEKRVLAFATTDHTVWVFKEDGLWRGTGDGYEMRFDPHDLSLRLLHPDAVCVADGVTYAWTNRGIVALTESSLAVISEPIANQLFDITSQMALYPDASFGAWAVAYPSEGQVHFGIPAAPTATTCTKVYVWHSEVGGWTTHDISAPSAVHSPADDLMYYATDQSPAVRKTRRSFTSTVPDTYDAADAVTVSSHTATTVTFSGTVTVAVGDALMQSNAVVAVFSVAGQGTTATVDDASAVSNAAATILRGYTCSVQYTDLALGNPLAQKLFWESGFNLEDLRRLYTFTVGWASDITSTAATQIVTRTRDTTAIPAPFRFGIPRSAARCTRLRLSWSTYAAGAAWALGEASVMYDLETERVRRG